jgi:polysaccharide biosynthesis transport protein
MVAPRTPQLAPVESISPEPAQADLEFDLRRYWDVVLKRRWTILVLLVAAVGVVAVATLRQTPIYQASTSIEIDLQLPQVLGQNVQDVVDTGSSYWYSKEYYLTQYKVITSHAVAERVVEKLRLVNDDQFLGIANLPPAERERIRPKLDAAEIMRTKVSVDPVKDSRIVFVHVEDPDPHRAQLYANTVAEAYIEHNLDTRLDTTRKASDWLQDQTTGLKSQLEASELATYEFKKANDTLSTSLEDRQNIISARLVALNEALTKNAARRAELSARADQYDAIRKTQPTDVPDVTAIAANPLVQNLKLKVADASQEFAEVGERYGPGHPKYIEIQKKLDSAQSNLRHEVDRLLSAADSDLAEAKSEEHNLISMIEVTKKEAFELNKKEIDYKKLARDEEENRRLYDLVLKRLKETDLSGALRTNNIHILDASDVPIRPVRPNLRLNLMLAVLFGLAGGVAVAFVLEQLDTSIRNQEDVERVVGVTFLGVVPSIQEDDERLKERTDGDVMLKNRDRFIETHPRSSVAECCRTIRTSLVFMTPDRPLRTILVFSSSPQEGKTTTAVNMAITMAQSDQKTLIVDSDMRRPRLHRTFGVPSATGLSTAILDESTIEEAVKATDVRNLFVLPCGPIPPNPTELLHSSAFERVVDALSKKFDRIIFDSPPTLAVADSAVLARVMDGAILVVKAGRTQKALAQRAVRLLQDVRANILGAVLNDLDLTRRGYGYYTYYYRGGYYYGSEKAENPPATPTS